MTPQLLTMLICLFDWMKLYMAFKTVHYRTNFYAIPDKYINLTHLFMFTYLTTYCSQCSPPSSHILLLPHPPSFYILLLSHPSSSHVILLPSSYFLYCLPTSSSFLHRLPTPSSSSFAYPSMTGQWSQCPPGVSWAGSSSSSSPAPGWRSSCGGQEETLTGGSRCPGPDTGGCNLTHSWNYC